MFTRGDTAVKIYDFDSQQEVYVGLLRREGDIYLVVDRAEWVRREHKLKN